METKIRLSRNEEKETFRTREIITKMETDYAPRGRTGRWAEIDSIAEIKEEISTQGFIGGYRIWVKI